MATLLTRTVTIGLWYDGEWTSGAQAEAMLENVAEDLRGHAYDLIDDATNTDVELVLL